MMEVSCKKGAVGEIWGVFIAVFTSYKKAEQVKKHSKTEPIMSLPRFVVFFFVASVNSFNFFELRPK